MTTKITPGPHTIFLSIFDQGDSIYDSAVLLDRMAFINEDPSTCKPPEVPVIVSPPAPAPGPPLPPPPPNDIRFPGSGVVFHNGKTFPVSLSVPGSRVVSGAQAPAATTSSTRARVAATRKLVKKATTTVAQADVVKLKMRLTRAGKKALRKKKRLKVRIAITFTPTGGTPDTEVRKVVVKRKTT